MTGGFGTYLPLAARLFGDDQGQDLIEYALLASFIGLISIAGATLLGAALNNWYSSASTQVDAAAASLP